jgi:hypothetical protein
MLLRYQTNQSGLRPTDKSYVDGLTNNLSDRITALENNNGGSLGPRVDQLEFDLRNFYLRADHITAAGVPPHAYQQGFRLFTGSGIEITLNDILPERDPHVPEYSLAAGTVGPFLTFNGPGESVLRMQLSLHSGYSLIEGTHDFEGGAIWLMHRWGF